MREHEELSCFDGLLWAKSNPFRPLIAHMVDVGICMRTYLKAASTAGSLNLISDLLGCSSKDAIGIASYIASLHDIGKATSHFQKKDDLLWAAWKNSFTIPKTFFMWDDFRHEVFGEQVLRTLWERERIIEDERL